MILQKEVCTTNIYEYGESNTRDLRSSDDLDKKVQAGLLKLEARTSTAIKHVQKSLEESLLTKFVT